MGEQVKCSIKYRGKSSEGIALLETTELVFRGTFRLVVPLSKVTAARARGGSLMLGYEGIWIAIHLGQKLAKKWTHKILNPKSLIDKLGIKPESRVSVIGIKDADFERQLIERIRSVPERTLQRDSDFIMLLAQTANALRNLRSITKYINKAGAIWVIFPRGSTSILEADVMAAGKRFGLVDTKVVRFSETHTGLKLVIPRALR